MVEIDEFEFAAAGAAGDVEGGESPEAGGVHVMDIFHVDDDALFGVEEFANFGAEERGVVGGELAMAFDNSGIVGAIAFDAKVVRVRVGVRIGVVSVGQGVSSAENACGEIIAG